MKKFLMLSVLFLMFIWTFSCFITQKPQFSKAEIEIGNQIILLKEAAMEEIPALSHYFDEMKFVSALATSSLVKVEYIDSNLSYYYFESTILKIPITKSKTQYKNGQIHTSIITVPWDLLD